MRIDINDGLVDAYGMFWVVSRQFGPVMDAQLTVLESKPSNIPHLGE